MELVWEKGKLLDSIRRMILPSHYAHALRFEQNFYLLIWRAAPDAGSSSSIPQQVLRTFLDARCTVGILSLGVPLRQVGVRVVNNQGWTFVFTFPVIIKFFAGLQTRKSTFNHGADTV